MAVLVECVPNFSEGNDMEKVARIVAPFISKDGVKLLDYSSDRDHNRTVVTVMGEPEGVKNIGYDRSDRDRHQRNRSISASNTKGSIPVWERLTLFTFIPIQISTWKMEAVVLARDTAWGNGLA
jgi:glutamate formiminotransferase